MVLSAEEFGSVLCCDDLPLHLNKLCDDRTKNMQSVCIHNVQTRVFYCYQNFILNGKTFLQMTKFLPDFIQCQQEPFKGCSLWLSFPSGQSVFLIYLIFAIFHLYNPSWQLSCSDYQEAKLRSHGFLQKRTMILDASCLFWTLTQNTLKKPGEKECSLCCNCIIQPMNS